MSKLSDLKKNIAGQKMGQKASEIHLLCKPVICKSITYEDTHTKKIEATNSHF